MSIKPLTTWVGCMVICLMTFAASAGEEKVIHLINGKDLSPFYSYTTNFGVDNDPDHVFTVQDGLVRISGQHMGYLATRETYSNYRLVAEFKWGEKTWVPREFNARDSGILVHCTGPDKVWMTSIECQLIEGGTGDVLVVEGAGLTVNGERKEKTTTRFDRPGRNPWKDEKGFRGPNEIENPHGEWNTVEVLCEKDKVRVTVNGHITIEGTQAYPQAGRISIQSEGAEVFFRKIDLYPLGGE
jgi:hypothetical protein